MIDYSKKSKIKILVNMATITVGGGVQASITFIEYLIDNRNKLFNCQFILVMSKDLIKHLEIDKLDFKIFIIKNSTSHPFKGFFSRKMLLEIEAKCNPDIIYSIGFPSYVKFKNLEIGRYTNPFEICDYTLAFQQLNIFEKIKRNILIMYRIYYAKKGDFFVTQTNHAKEGIVKNLKVNKTKVFVSPNTLNSRFSFNHYEIKNLTNKNIKNIFCLSASHKHKNLEIIPHVAFCLLKKVDFDFKFYLTLPNDSYILKNIFYKAKSLRVQNNIINLGTLSLDSVYEQYKLSDCLFLPTLLEIFSATYLEAMAMGVPIVTTRLDFAREICGEAATYYEPISSKDAALKLETLLSNELIKKKQISLGFQQLKQFPTQNQKFEILIYYIIKCEYNRS